MGISAPRVSRRAQSTRSAPPAHASHTRDAPRLDQKYECSVGTRNTLQTVGGHTPCSTHFAVQARSGIAGKCYCRPTATAQQYAHTKLHTPDSSHERTRGRRHRQSDWRDVIAAREGCVLLQHGHPGLTQGFLRLGDSCVSARPEVAMVSTGVPWRGTTNTHS